MACSFHVRHGNFLRKWGDEGAAFSCVPLHLTTDDWHTVVWLSQRVWAWETSRLLPVVTVTTVPTSYRALHVTEENHIICRGREFDLCKIRIISSSNSKTVGGVWIWTHTTMYCDCNSLLFVRQLKCLWPLTAHYKWRTQPFGHVMSSVWEQL